MSLNNATRNIPSSIRQAIFERDNYTCQYCGYHGEDIPLEVEHIIPVSKGGINDVRNLVTACRTCNRAKRDKILSREDLSVLAEKIQSSLDFLLNLIGEPVIESIASSYRISMLVPDETVRKLRIIAVYRDKSLNSLIADILSKAVLDWESKHGEIEFPE